jgi:hypothetical protein
VNRQDIIDILSVVRVVDHRTIGEVDVIVWFDTIGDLAKDDALQAVRAHFREQPGVWLEPGHVVTGVRAIQRDRYDRQSEAERAEREAICDAKVAGWAAELEAATAIPDDGKPIRYTRPSTTNDPAVAARAAALKVSCPHCHANIGQPCHNSATGTRLKELPAHHDRVAVAEGRPPSTPRSVGAAAITAPPGPPADPCLRCGRWIRLGPEARKSENPSWCGECNFTQAEFMRLRAQDEVLGQPVRQKLPPMKGTT